MDLFDNCTVYSTLDLFSNLKKIFNLHVGLVVVNVF